MGAMTVLQWQLICLVCMLLLGVVALFCRKIFWLRACIALGLLLPAALQLLLVPPDQHSAGRSRLPFRLGLDLRGGTEIRLRSPAWLRLHPPRRHRRGHLLINLHCRSDGGAFLCPPSYGRVTGEP